MTTGLGLSLWGHRQRHNASMSDDGDPLTAGELLGWLKGVDPRARIVIELQDPGCTTFLRVDAVEYSLDGGMAEGPDDVNEEVILGSTALVSDWPTTLVVRPEDLPKRTLP